MKEKNMFCSFGLRQLVVWRSRRVYFSGAIFVPKLVPRQIPTVPPDAGGQMDAGGKSEATNIRKRHFCERQSQETSKNFGSNDEKLKIWPSNKEDHNVRIVKEEDSALLKTDAGAE